MKNRWADETCWAKVRRQRYASTQTSHMPWSNPEIRQADFHSRAVRHEHVKSLQPALPHLGFSWTHNRSWVGSGASCLDVVAHVLLAARMHIIPLWDREAHVESCQDSHAVRSCADPIQNQWIFSHQQPQCLPRAFKSRAQVHSLKLFFAHHPQKCDCDTIFSSSSVLT